MRVQSAFAEEFRVLPDLESNHTRLLALVTPTVKYVIPFSKTSFEAASCAPPTPVGDLDQYANNINSLHSRIAQVLNGTPANSMVMGPFAQAVNSLANYVNTLPDQFCIGPGNQVAFDCLNTALSNAGNTIQRGKNFFEANLDRFVGQATPLLNNLYNASSAINSSSRDFAQVIAAAQRYDGYVNQFQLDIWSLTARIDNLWNQFEQSFNTANAALIG